MSLRAPHHPTSSLAALAALGLFAAACDADPIGGGGGAGGDDTSVSTVTGTGGSGEVATTTVTGTGGGQVGTSTGVGGGSSTSTGGGDPGETGIALFGDEIPETGGGGGTSVASSGVGGGGGGFDPDRLYLFLSNQPQLCSDPFGVDPGCELQTFQAVIGLPPEYQTEGTYDLDDPAIISNFGEFGPDGQGGCQGGGGSFWEGTIRITLIDDTTIRVILEGTSPATLDGAHEVSRCGSQPPEESSVIGFFPSDLPDPGSGSSVATTGGGAEKFVLVFADHAQSCADPFGNQPGPGEVHHELVVRLPQEYLVPGEYDLTDPALEASTFQYEENTAVSGGGGPIPGTLTILSVSDDSLEIELEGTPYDYANGAGSVPRCTGD